MTEPTFWVLAVEGSSYFVSYEKSGDVRTVVHAPDVTTAKKFASREDAKAYADKFGWRYKLAEFTFGGSRGVHP